MAGVTVSRKCTKTTCGQAAVATLTYAYADRAVVVGPLATCAEPHAYDLCAEHATRMTAPRGWDVVRLSANGYVPVEVSDADDLLAVVEAVRERPAVTSRPLPAPALGTVAPPAHAGPPHAGPPYAGPPFAGPVHAGAPHPAAGRRTHLRVLPGGETP